MKVFFNTVLLKLFIVISMISCESKQKDYFYLKENKDLRNNIPYYILKSIDFEFKNEREIYVIYACNPNFTKFILSNKDKTNSLLLDELNNQIRSLNSKEINFLKEIDFQSFIYVLKKKDLFPNRRISSYSIVGIAKFVRRELVFEYQKKLYNISNSD